MLICVFKIISRKVIDKAKFEFLFWVFKGFSHLVVIKRDTEWVVAHVVRIASRNITDGHSWKEEEDAEEKIPRVWREHLSHLMIMIIMMILRIYSPPPPSSPRERGGGRNPSWIVASLWLEGTDPGPDPRFHYTGSRESSLTRMLFAGRLALNRVVSCSQSGLAGLPDSKRWRSPARNFSQSRSHFSPPLPHLSTTNLCLKTLVAHTLLCFLSSSSKSGSLSLSHPGLAPFCTFWARCHRNWNWPDPRNHQPLLSAQSSFFWEGKLCCRLKLKLSWTRRCPLWGGRRFRSCPPPKWSQSPLFGKQPPSTPPPPSEVRTWDCCFANRHFLLAQFHFIENCQIWNWRNLFPQPLHPLQGPV